MILNIVCAETELAKIKKVFPNCEVKVEVVNEGLGKSSSTERKMNFRQDLIKNLLTSEEIDSMSLFYKVRKKGYPVAYRTFKRDVEYLSSLGEITKNSVCRVDGKTELYSSNT